MVHNVINAGIGTLAVLAGCVCMLGYAVPSLEDLGRAHVPFAEALLNCVLLWALALGALYMGYLYLLRLFPK